MRTSLICICMAISFALIGDFPLPSPDTGVAYAVEGPPDPKVEINNGTPTTRTKDEILKDLEELGEKSADNLQKAIDELRREILRKQMEEMLKKGTNTSGFGIITFGPFGGAIPLYLLG